MPSLNNESVNVFMVSRGRDEACHSAHAEICHARSMKTTFWCGTVDVFSRHNFGVGTTTACSFLWIMKPCGKYLLN